MERRSFLKFAGGVAGGALFGLGAVRKAISAPVVLPAPKADLYISGQPYKVIPEPKPDLSNDIKAYYDLILLDRALPNLVMPAFQPRANSSLGLGKRIEFRRFSDLPDPMTLETISTHEFAASIDPYAPLQIAPSAYGTEDDV